jgi:hypothetical protein
MEGHRTNEEPGRSLGPRDRYSSLAATKRAFLLLDKERASLKVRLRSPWHPLGRYEDLCLITMLTRLERDWLTQPTSRVRGGDRHPKDGDTLGRGVAEWAKPWRLAPLTTLDTDVRRFDGSMRRLGKWLSPLAMVGAERSARERLERIRSQLEERDPRQPPVPATATDGHGVTTRMIARPSQIRMAAAVGVFLVAAAAVGLVTSDPGSGPGIFATSPGGEGRVSDRPGVLAIGTEGRRATGGRAGHATHRSRRHGRDPNGRRRAGATRHPRRARTTVVSAAVAPSPQAPSAPEPAPASEPASLPQPPDLSPSPTTTKAESGGGGGCPPEFGYEC